MTTPDSPEYRKYLNRVDKASRSVVVAFAVCGIGFALGQIYVGEHIWQSVYYGPRLVLWGSWSCGIGTIACLLAVVGFIGESLLRAWNRRPLTRWELLAAAPIGLLARGAICVSLYVTFLVIEFGVIYPAQFRF